MARRTGACALSLVASLLLATVVALVSPAVATQRPVGPEAVAAADPDPADRESMRNGYLQILKPALGTPIGWTGDLTSCEAGAPSSVAQQATLTAVNYFRDLVGVEPVTFSATLSARAQQAALMMARNGALNHTPPDTWECWTAEGAAAAGKSDLALGNAGAAAVAAYMEDGGDSNEIAGHRRWIIDPRQTTMGSGSVKGSGWQSTSNALYVLDTASWQVTPASTPEYLPWPVAGYVPVQIEPGGRWSLSARDPDTDFSQAMVTVNGSGTGVTVHPVANGYGPSTLVWDFDPGFASGDADRTYHVVVSDIVVDGVRSSYSYDVTLFDAEASTVPDTEPPTVSRLGKDFAVRLGGFDTDWVASDASGVDGFQQRQRTRMPGTPFGAWSSPDGWTDSAGGTWAARTPGETLCLSARARDTAGNVSAWSAPVCVHTPVDDASLTAGRGWRTLADDALWLGSARTTRRQGATLTGPSAVDVDRVGLVATRCRGCGKVGVYVGRTKLGVIGLGSRSTSRRVVMVLPRPAAPLDGPVRVVVESTDRKVQIDGIVVSGTPAD